MAQISQQDIDALLKMIKKSLVDSVTFPEKGTKEEFENNTLLFLDKFNVIEKPKVYYQCELI